MKNRHKRAIAGLLLLGIIIALGIYIGKMPEGVLEVGHCGNVSLNSDVCFCYDNETRVVINNTYVCETLGG